MGYTHYWKGKPNLTDALVADVNSIIAAAPAFGFAVAGPLGEGEPEVSTEGIVLNGDSETGDDYETFALYPRVTSFTFCKTARMPYDAVVGAILLRVAMTSPDFSVESDGDPTDPEDWGDATTLYSTVFDEPAPVELVNA